MKIQDEVEIIGVDRKTIHVEMPKFSIITIYHAAKSLDVMVRRSNGVTEGKGIWTNEGKKKIRIEIEVLE